MVQDLPHCYGTTHWGIYDVPWHQHAASKLVAWLRACHLHRVHLQLLHVDTHMPFTLINSGTQAMNQTQGCQTDADLQHHKHYAAGPNDRPLQTPAVVFS